MSDTELQLPSNRSFGWVFTVFFSLVGGYSAWKHGSLWPWFFGLAGITALVTLVAPGVLAPLNRAWMKFGLLLNRIVSPIVLGAMFYGILAPVGIAMRLFGRDPMARRFDKSAPSYWVRRDPPGPDPKNLPFQF